jgi:Ca2+-transporting ATPase
VKAVKGLDLAAMDAADAYAALGTGPEGLSPVEAAARLQICGPNEVPAPPRRPGWSRLLAQVTHFMALLLWAAGALAFVAGLPELGWAIFAVVIVNGLFGAWQEHRAERALAALEGLMPRRARVVRAGRVVACDAGEVVPGDLLLLEEGDRVPADARIVSAALFQLDVSVLTGESAAVARDAAPAAAAPSLAEASCVAPAGATVASGRARAAVFATGAAAELGRIARLATATRRERSTLEVQVSRLVRIVSLIAVGMGAAVFGLLQLLGAAPGESLLFAIGILVANVPEGLLPAITITLAVNVQRMARRRVLVSRLSAVETLGAVDVICTDKTGTLTRNALDVRLVWTPDAGELAPGAPGAALPLALAVLASDAVAVAGGLSGDPLERALLSAAIAAGLEPEPLRASCRRLAELPFDPRRKRMTVVVRAAGAVAEAAVAPCAAIAKGAPLAILDRCTHVLRGGAGRPLDEAARAAICAALDGLARRGLRVVAAALRGGDEGLARLDVDALEQDLTFVALLAMEDPPRSGVREALATCRRAGITVTVVTGDHGETARAVAEEVGLWSSRARVVDGPALAELDDRALEALLAAGHGLVFARVSPEEKLRLVRAYQRLGHVVAVTGDGVNDAPALRAAHVGVAMGLSGTDVARAAADVVLLDDDFATIVAAVEEGRATYANVRKFLAYILTSNVPEIVPFIAMAVLRIPPALGILQILAIDLGTDMLPALALGAEPPEPGGMLRPPRPRERRLLDPGLLARAYGLLGLAEAAAALAAYLAVWRGAGHGLAELRAITPALLSHAAPPAVMAVQRAATAAALAAIVCCQVGNVLACRSEHLLPHRTGAPPGALLRWGVGAELVLLAAILYVPPLQVIFGTAAPPPALWPWLAACAPAMLVVDAIHKRARRGRSPPRHPASAHSSKGASLEGGPRAT